MQPQPLGKPDARNRAGKIRVICSDASPAIRSLADTPPRRAAPSHPRTARPTNCTDNGSPFAREPRAHRQRRMPRHIERRARLARIRPRNLRLVLDIARRIEVRGAHQHIHLAQRLIHRTDQLRPPPLRTDISLRREERTGHQPLARQLPVIARPLPQPVCVHRPCLRRQDHPVHRRKLLQMRQHNRAHQRALRLHQPRRLLQPGRDLRIGGHVPFRGSGGRTRCAGRARRLPALR